MPKRQITSEICGFTAPLLKCLLKGPTDPRIHRTSRPVRPDPPAPVAVETCRQMRRVPAEPHLVAICCHATYCVSFSRSPLQQRNRFNCANVPEPTGSYHPSNPVSTRSPRSPRSPRSGSLWDFERSSVRSARKDVNPGILWGSIAHCDPAVRALFRKPKG